MPHGGAEHQARSGQQALGGAGGPGLGAGDPEVQITLTVGANDGLPKTSKSAVPDIKLTKVQLLSAIKAAVRSFQGDDSVSPAARTLLLALAAYAMAELDASVQMEDRSAN